MDEATVQAVLAFTGLIDGDPSVAPPFFLRRDGSPARLERRADLVQLGPPVPPDEPLVVQVSRWDRLKDPVGVLRGFVRHAESDEAHLVIAGPATAGVADDPEGAEVLGEVLKEWRAVPQPARTRVHLACLPMDDAEENFAIVNALQTRADVIVQKSLAEGFGLTVAEGMWKSRPVVAGGVGGIQDQIVDEVTGLLVDPTDLSAFGHALTRLLGDSELSARLGAAGHESVREHFLGARHLRQWVEAIERLPAASAVRD
jgi:trehalose synthase